jgi:hypothetical protein
MRVIFPIKPNSPVRLETTIVNGRHQDQHQEKKIKLLNSVTKERITQLNAEGYRVKEIHAILLKEFGKDKSPTRLQIRNYISRNRIAKLNGSETNTQVKSHDDVQTEINGESNGKPKFLGLTKCRKLRKNRLFYPVFMGFRQSTPFYRSNRL